MRLISPLRFLTRSLADYIIPRWLAKHPANISEKVSEVVVSLTSYPARIDTVWQVVECMLRQTLRPRKIILWLSREQFPDKDSIPSRLLKYESNLFEVRLVAGDIRSHKKYYYVSHEYADCNVLLIDDDIYYPSDMIERMWKLYREGKNVVCQYGYRIKYNADGKLAPYKSWYVENDYYEGKDFFFGSGGGVLFRPSSLYTDLTNLTLALQLCPTADDIWLNAMVRLANLPIIKIARSSSCVLPIRCSNNKTSLTSINVVQGANDVQLLDVNNYYNRKVF